MPLRVIAGSAKGRRLKAVPGDTTRPVTDMVKEALFDILGAEVDGSLWWDLFGGTGAIGIEALSRGAGFVRFSDVNRSPVETIRQNLATCGLSERAEVQRGDAFAMLAAESLREFDYIYIAPPQYKELWSRALALIDQHPGWLSSGGWVVAQIHPREFHELLLRNLIRIDQRKYGSTMLVFYEKQDA
jgi:16S rRNA (guanine(966)-N(2))-methyltransferase RsmD